MAEVLVVSGETVLQRLAVGAAPFHMGRAHTNDLVLTDGRVSAHHAVLWWDGSGFRLEDMGSRNGTYVNGAQISGARVLVDGDEIRIGDTVLRLHGAVDALPRPNVTVLPCLEDLQAGVRFPLWSDRFHIGSGRDCDLRLDDAPERVATLLVYDDGEVWLGRDGVDAPLELGESFEIGGRAFRLGTMEGGVAPTTGMETDRYPYRIVATLNGASGPEAEVEHMTWRPRYRVEADTRAVLLYLLAERLLADRDERKAGAEQGWCTDDEVARGIWGRARGGQDTNSLNVLVHRVRKELTGAGFEPWFIEKRRRRIRVRVTDVALR